MKKRFYDNYDYEEAYQTVEQSAAVLTVAMDAYKQARKGKGE